MNERQIIISIGREFGSGGHEIAEHIAKDMELPFYDYNLMGIIAGEKNTDAKLIAKYDEMPKSPFFTRTVRGFSSSPEENIANMQFDFLRKKAGEGESFVILGRCSETVLKDFVCMIPIFILGDLETKIKRIMEIHGLAHDKAYKLIKIHDKFRKSYHNYYCATKWGDSRNYELSINSSKLGIQQTVEVIEGYIEKRYKEMK